MTENNLLEVLAPVGDMERLYAALDFGADAVYLGGTAFGMRAASASFDAELLKKACDEAHSRGKRVYLTCNTLPHNDEIVHLSLKLCLKQNNNYKQVRFEYFFPYLFAK